MDSAHLAQRLTAAVGLGPWDVRYGYRAGSAVIDIMLTKGWSFPVGMQADDMATAIRDDLAPATPPRLPLRAWPLPAFDAQWSTTRTTVTFDGHPIDGCVWPSYLRIDGAEKLIGQWDVSVRDCVLTAQQLDRFARGPGLLAYTYDGKARTGMAVVEHSSAAPNPRTGERGYVEFRIPVYDPSEGL